MESDAICEKIVSELSWIVKYPAHVWELVVWGNSPSPQTCWNWVQNFNHYHLRPHLYFPNSGSHYTVIAYLLVCVTHRPKGKDFIYLVGLPTGSLVSATWQQLNCLSAAKHILAVQRSLSRLLFPEDALNWEGRLREPNNFLNPVILCVTQCCVILTPKLDM